MHATTCAQGSSASASDQEESPSTSQAAVPDVGAAIKAFEKAATDFGRAVATAQNFLRTIMSPKDADLQRDSITLKCAWHV